MDFIRELRWRGMVHTITPDLEEKLSQEQMTGYIGFDPTAQSLQIGNLAAIMLLVHFQRAGHIPVALIGGATGMIGDPSGKSQERVLMSIDELRYNQMCQKKQLNHFLDFHSQKNAAIIVNNYDWFHHISFLDFLREVGKHLTINYMIAKDSVQQRLESGFSFTEFSYQLLQAYDFYWLNKNKNCQIQMGGSDQWGNITAGIELIRRKSAQSAFAVTCPLITKSDGSKFGKSSTGENLWLDPKMTSPFKFYQFWLNCSDEDVCKYIRVFSLLSKDEIIDLEKKHDENPGKRPMQKALSKELTIRVHSESDFQSAEEASQILFGKGTTNQLIKISEKDFLEIFEGVTKTQIPKETFDKGFDCTTFLSEKTNIFSSKGEVRRMIQNNGLSINKLKITDPILKINSDYLLNGKYILIQKGKKNYFVVQVI